MPDLSTPLLDAMHSKLRDESLDCRSFSYYPNTFFGDSTVPNSQDSISADSTGIIHLQTPAPSPGPTIPLFCPPDYTGPLPYDGCSAYYYCTYGIPN